VQNVEIHAPYTYTAGLSAFTIQCTIYLRLCH